MSDLSTQRERTAALEEMSRALLRLRELGVVGRWDTSMSPGREPILAVRFDRNHTTALAVLLGLTR